MPETVRKFVQQFRGNRQGLGVRGLLIGKFGAFRIDYLGCSDDDVEEIAHYRLTMNNKRAG